MLISTAAVAGMEGEQFDFFMAFTQSDCEEPDQYTELPDIPASLLAEYPDLGPGRGSDFVGRLLKELYGRHYASRGFSLCVRERLQEMGKLKGVRITIFTSDRCAFSMSWNDHHLIGGLHSDDGIFFYSSIIIRNKFIELLEERFILETGPVDVYCGLEIDYQPERRRASIRQTRHIDMMLKIFRMTNARPEKYPLPTGRPGELAAQRWTGEATEISHFDYAMFIGDLVWVTKTRFDLKHAAHLLAQQMRNPGPHQVHAANHVLQYLVGTRDMALEFSIPESPEGWPLCNKLITSADSGHNHYGAPGETGVVILLNGGTVYAVTRRQTTVSKDSFSRKSWRFSGRQYHSVATAVGASKL